MPEYFTPAVDIDEWTKTNRNNVSSDQPIEMVDGHYTATTTNSSSGTRNVSAPIDLDEVLSLYRGGKMGHGIDDDDDDDELASIFSQEEDDERSGDVPVKKEMQQFFHNPHRRLLDSDASLIPGSPFSKPANRPSNRPKEPLGIAKTASLVAFFMTFGWVGFLFFAAIWSYDSVGRIVVEAFLAILSFMGLFWNTYFIVSSIFKCFIPSQAFKTNTKYCSIIPENKRQDADWLAVTIQIPVYKESLLEVLMPTLKSCIASRDFYTKNTDCSCNIVVCDDGMMNYLKDNFAAAEMLWETIVATEGKEMRLSRLVKRVPRASRRHLKGLRSKNVYEVFHRMLFYYHYNIGFVARSTIDRRGKFKKASNLNSHLRLALGAAQVVEDAGGEITFDEALVQNAFNDDGSRFVMFGNNIQIGDLIVINDADARMAESVILKTVPEFLNDPSLGFTQHATKTMNEQRGESYFTNLLTVYTDALYQGHFLLSSILGCHPPLVGHSIFLRTEAVRQVGQLRTLRKAQRWLQNIGLHFLPVDQVGFSNLQAKNRLEYWSESHVSEDFELMIHLYNLGFDGRYCAYPDCEFQEGITRTFDEEAGRHRKFALGAHELVFNPFQDMLGHGIFTPLFRTFLSCDIPSYYKVFLTAYLCSYSAGGAFIVVFTVAALARILDSEEDVDTLYYFTPAGIIILNFIVFYVLGYITFIIALLRMYWNNKMLLFPEYRKKRFGSFYLVFVMLRYSLVFQFLFYSVATLTFYFLGSMDHLLSRPGIVSATNKDSINISRCTAFWDMARFNRGSWMLALTLGALGYITVLQDMDWKYDQMPDDIVKHALFAGAPIFLCVMSFIVPIVLNPFVLGWPFLRKRKEVVPPPPPIKRNTSSGSRRQSPHQGRELTVTLTKKLDTEIQRMQSKPDVELGSLATPITKPTTSPVVTKSKLVDVDRTLKNQEIASPLARWKMQAHNEVSRQQQQQQVSFEDQNNRHYRVDERAPNTYSTQQQQQKQERKPSSARARGSYEV